MKVLPYSFRKKPNGYGYYKIMVDVRHKDGDIETLHHLTNDMKLIDQLQSEEDIEVETAKEKLINSILVHNIYN